MMGGVKRPQSKIKNWSTPLSSPRPPRYFSLSPPFSPHFSSTFLDLASCKKASESQEVKRYLHFLKECARRLERRGGYAIVSLSLTPLSLFFSSKNSLSCFSFARTAPFSHPHLLLQTFHIQRDTHVRTVPHDLTLSYLILSSPTL